MPELGGFRFETTGMPYEQDSSGGGSAAGLKSMETCRVCGDSPARPHYGVRKLTHTQSLIIQRFQLLVSAAKVSYNVKFCKFKLQIKLI
jgi:hypothetical protein